MALTKEQILSALPKSKNDLPREAVEAWGGTVFVRALSGTERDEFEVETSGIRELGDNPLIGVRARIVAWCCCDESGQRLFNSKDAAELGKADAGTLDKVFAVAGRLSGFTDNDVKDLAKNLNGTGGDATSSS